MADKDWKMPLKAKIYEAFTAVIDGRVTLHKDYATVKSSDYSKEYRIIWDGDVYSSNDNASYWQGSMGYPVIAVLMMQGKINYDIEKAKLFNHIEWKKIIRSHKNDYTRAAALVLSELEKSGINVKPLLEEADRIYEQIGKLKIERRRGATRPPK